MTMRKFSVGFASLSFPFFFRPLCLSHADVGVGVIVVALPPHPLFTTLFTRKINMKNYSLYLFICCGLLLLLFVYLAVHMDHIAQLAWLEYARFNFAASNSRCSIVVIQLLTVIIAYMHTLLSDAKHFWPSIYSLFFVCMFVCLFVGVVPTMFALLLFLLLPYSSANAYIINQQHWNCISRVEALLTFSFPFDKSPFFRKIEKISRN